MDKEGMNRQMGLHGAQPAAREAWAASRARAEALARRVPDDLVHRAGNELNRSLVARAERLMGLGLGDNPAVVASDTPERSGGYMRSGITLDIGEARVGVAKFDPVADNFLAVRRYGVHLVDENGEMIQFTDTEYDERQDGEPLGNRYLGRIEDYPEAFDDMTLPEAHAALVHGFEADENLTTIEAACGLEPLPSLDTPEHQWLAGLVLPQPVA